MGLMSRLADAMEMQAGATSEGSAMSRAAVALEAIAGAANLGDTLPERIRKACYTIATNDGKTPVAQRINNQFYESAENLELVSGMTITATAIERMILAATIALTDTNGNILTDTDGNILVIGIF